MIQNSTLRQTRRLTWPLLSICHPKFTEALFWVCGLMIVIGGGNNLQAQPPAVITTESWSLPKNCQSRPVVREGILWVIAPDPEYAHRQYLYALESKTGEQLWAYLFPEALPETASAASVQPDTSVSSNPVDSTTVDSTTVSRELGRAELVFDSESQTIVALGSSGTLVCLESRTGKRLWQRSLVQEFGFQTPPRTRNNLSPLANLTVHDGSVVVSGLACSWGEQSRLNHRFLGIDIKTSAILWSKGYNTPEKWVDLPRPQLAIIHGEPLIIATRSSGHVLAIQPRTGALAWAYTPPDFVTDSTTPVIIEDLIIYGVLTSSPSTNESMPQATTEAKVETDPEIKTVAQPQTTTAIKTELLAQQDQAAIVARVIALKSPAINVNKDEKSGSKRPQSLRTPAAGEPLITSRVPKTLWTRTRAASGLPLFSNSSEQLAVLWNRQHVESLDLQTGEPIGSEIELPEPVLSALFPGGGETLGLAMNHSVGLVEPSKLQLFHFLPSSTLPSSTLPPASPPATRQITIPDNLQVNNASQVCIEHAESALFVTTPEFVARIPFEHSEHPQDNVNPRMRPAETPVVLDQTPTQVVVSPMENSLSASMSQRLQIKLYNSKGQFLSLASQDQLEFGILGPGTLDHRMNFQVPPEAAAQAGSTLLGIRHRDSLTLFRNRLIPPLDWNLDFEEAGYPLHWLGKKTEIAVIDEQLFDELAKTSEFRLQLYLRLSSLFLEQGSPLQLHTTSAPITFGELKKELAISLPGPAADFTDELRQALEDLRARGLLSGFTLTPEPEQSMTLVAAPYRPTSREILTIAHPPRPATPESRLNNSDIPTHIVMGSPDLKNDSLKFDVRFVPHAGKTPTLRMAHHAAEVTLDPTNETIKLRLLNALETNLNAQGNFQIDPDVWYTVQLRTEVADTGSTVGFKIWKRTEPQPESWLISHPLTLPDFSSSPMFGSDSHAGRILIDNMHVGSATPRLMAPEILSR